jgi:hypothetical protein
MASRIERIIDLEKRAEAPEAVADKLKWEAAHLYWLEVTSNGKPRSDIARQIGKSAMHVLFMYRCWQRIVVDTKLEYGNDYGNLPPFNKVYHSDTIRESDDEHGKPLEEKRQRQGEDKNELTADEMATTARTMIEKLLADRALREQLSGRGLEDLRQTHRKLTVLISRVGR